jgi:hypothetical protein
MEPFFIIGQARSGTNLTARILARHPEVSVALDPFMPVFRAIRDSIIRNHGSDRLQARVRPGAPFRDYYFDPCGNELLHLMFKADLAMRLPDGEIDSLRTACRERASLESPEMGKKMTSLRGKTYSDLLQSMFDLLANAASYKSCIGCKELWVEDFVPLLARAMPNCRFILTERDPRAIIASLLAVAANDPSQAAHTPSYMRHWRKGVALTRRHLADQELASRVLLVRYENLTADPERESQRLCSFLTLEFEPAMLAVSRDGWNGNSGYEHNENNVYQGSLERWKKRLTTEMISTVDFLCGPEMNLTPYKPVASNGTDNSVVECLLNANSEKYSWRSDSGDALADFAWEVLRHRLVNKEQCLSKMLLRRCFLFPETFQAILSNHKTSSTLTTIQ